MINPESHNLILLSLIPISNLNKQNYSIHNSNHLGSYLAGLIEGDGSIYTPLNAVDSKATKNVPYIEIAFDPCTPANALA
jgi:hypothetical protein